MEKIKLYLGDFKVLEQNYKQKSGSGSINFYEHLVFEVLRLKIKEDFVYLNPNYKQLDSSFVLQFLYKESLYELEVEGEKRLILVRGIKMQNINKFNLKFLKS